MVSWSACGRAADAQSSELAAPRDAPASAFESGMAEAEPDSGFRGGYRLRKTDEFSSVFAFRKTLRGRHLDMLHRPNVLDTARLGVVVAKKNVRSAVNRNLIKRIVRESFRLTRSKLPKRDIVVRVSVRMEKPDRRVLRGEIDELFARLAQ
jgi:ribonuclease P protein component